MKKILLTMTVATAIASAGFMSNMSFAYGKDSGKADKNFIRDNTLQVVKDLKSGKTYSDTAPSAKMSYSDALKYCTDMNLLGVSDWELPSIDELKAIMELGRRDLNVKRAFKNVQEGIYWSATKDRRGDAWYVDFDLGRYSTTEPDHTYYTLCVREGETPKKQETLKKEDVNKTESH